MPSYTIGSVKSTIEANDGTPADQQRLIIAGKHLDPYENRRLSECGVKNNDTIHMVRRVRETPAAASSPSIAKPSGGSMRIYIKTPTGRIHTIDVEPSSTISDVKSSIRDKADVHPHQRLFFRGTRLRDEYRLSDCGIKSEPSLSLYTGFDSDSEDRHSTTKAPNANAKSRWFFGKKR